MNGVFVLFEGIDSTIFASQVSQHVHDMAKRGIRLRILAFEPNAKKMAQSRKNKAHIESLYPNIEIQLKPCMSVFLPFSMVVNLVILGLALRQLHRQERVDFIHARADYCASLCALLLRFSRIPVIWDCRGAAEAELDALLDRKLKGPLSQLVLGASVAAAIAYAIVAINGLDFVVRGYYSIIERQNMLEFGMNLTFSWLGTGIGSFGALFLGFDTYYYPHNIFLELLIENGIVGLALFCLCTYVVIFRRDRSEFKSLFLFFLAAAMFSGDIVGNAQVLYLATAILMTKRQTS